MAVGRENGAQGVTAGQGVWFQDRGGHRWREQIVGRPDQWRIPVKPELSGPFGDGEEVPECSYAVRTFRRVELVEGSRRWLEYHEVGE